MHSVILLAHRHVNTTKPMQLRVPDLDQVWNRYRNFNFFVAQFLHIYKNHRFLVPLN